MYEGNPTNNGSADFVAAGAHGELVFSVGQLARPADLQDYLRRSRQIPDAALKAA